MTRTLRFAVVLLAVLRASAPSEVAAQTGSVTGLSLNSPASGDTWTAGETIIATLTFSGQTSNQNTCGGGNPLRLEVRIGTATRNMRCPATGGAILDREHSFSYVVQSDDVDADGISIAAGALVGGTLSDLSVGGAPNRDLGTHAITNDANHKVDGSLFAAGASGVTGVALNTPVLGGTFERGEAIEVTVTFNRTVDVTGTPQLGLGIGSNTRQASYVSGSGSTALLFRYTVVTADVDSNGLSIAATALGLNSGTIRTEGTTTNTLLGLGAHAITDSANHQVNGGTLTAAAVSDVSITSTPAGGDAYYRLGEVIQVTVTFNRAVNVVTTGGIPQLALTVGTQTRQSALNDIPGMGRLIFGYTVAAGDFDDDGISIAADALSLNGGTINDARSATTAASLGLGTHAITNDADHKVAAPPFVLGTNGIAVTSPGDGSTFERGERIDVTVNFNRAVDVTGTPQVALGIGTETRQADYVSGSGTASPVFRYTVVQADVDADGISIAATALALNGGTIRASAADRTDATLGLGANAFTDSSTRLVNGGTFTAAAVRTPVGAAIVSSPASGDTYGLGERIELQITFTRRVVVTGTPQVGLVVGNIPRYADYASGSGTNALIFRYVVQGAGSGGNGAGGVDRDTTGVATLPNGLTLNGGAIDDARDTTEAATVSPLGQLSDQVNHKVNGGDLRQPAVTGVAVASAPPAGGSYGRGAAILVRVTFDRSVRVTGTPLLALEIGSARRQAAYSSGTGTPELVFRYVVRGGDSDPDGFSVPANALTLNGGAIELVGAIADETVQPRPIAMLDHALLNAVGHAVDAPRGGGGGNAAPAFVESAYVFALAENTAGPLVLGVAEASDPDAGDVLTYALKSGDAERFAVDAETGEVRYVGAGEDAETGPDSWELTVSATDPAGRAAEAAVTVRLTDENEAPAFTMAEHAFALAENTAGPLVLGTVRASDPDAGDVLTYALESGDAERFAVDAETGEVRYVGAGEDAETGPDSWELTVSATDPEGLTASAAVTVRLTDENEAPVFGQPAYAFELAENRRGPLELGRVEAADADADDTRRYSLAAGDAGRFAVDAETGAVRYVGRGEDYESGPTSFALMVRVADAGGLTAEADVSVAVRDVNEAPAFAQPAYAFELEENAAGPLVLGGVEASDVDAGDVLTYSLAAGDAGRFAVDAKTGEVRYAGAGEDYESGPTSFALTVRVTDAGGLTAEADVSVAILDVNEAPEAVGVPAPLVLEAYGASAEADLGPHFRDPDGDVLSWAAESSSPSTARVSVSEAGLLTVVPQAIGAAVVTVTASDPEGLSAVQEVQVTVEASRAARAEALKRSLAVFGRTVGSEAVEAVGGRLGLESSGALGRSHVQVGGRALGCGALAGGEECSLTALARGASGLLGAQLSMPADALGAAGGGGASLDPIALLFGDGSGGFDDGSGGLGGPGGFGGAGFGGGFGGGGGRGAFGAAGPRAGGVAFSPVSGRSLLSQSSFQVPLGGAAEAEGAVPSPSRRGWTLWGQAAAGEFEGASVGDGVGLEGRTRSAWAGADYRFGSGALVGLAVSHNRMASDFVSRVNGAGKVDARLTSLYPYLHWSPRAGLGLWGMAGGGRGEAGLEDAGGRFDAGLGMRMTALGVRQALAGPLALKADAFAVRIRSEDVTDMAGVTAAARRLRLASELTGRWAVSEGVALRARVELGARLDGGDAETGLGAEAGGSVGFTHLRTGLSVEARGRTLLVHQAEDFREWGAGFAVRLQPGRERGGLSLALEPYWGEAAGGAGRLWNAPGGFGPQTFGRRDFAYAPGDAPGLAPDGLAMELGWGVMLPGGGEFTPFGRWSREGADARRLHAGTRWTVLQRPVEGRLGGFTLPRDLRLMVDLFAEQFAAAGRPAENRFVLLGRAGF